MRPLAPGYVETIAGAREAGVAGIVAPGLRRRIDNQRGAAYFTGDRVAHLR